MQRSTAWRLGAGGGMLGAGAVLAPLWPGSFGEPAFAALLFLDVTAASFLGAQAHRRGLGGAALTAAAAGALGLVGFFGAAILLAAGAVPAFAIGVFLGLTPLVGAACSAGGAIFLARGVDRYRERRGLVDAPR